MTSLPREHPRRRDLHRRHRSAARPAPSPRRTRPWRSLIAATAATLFAAPFTLPAFAATTEPDAIDVIRVLERPQSVTISADGAVAAISRDNATVSKPSPKPRPTADESLGGNTATANTFTNNPASPVQWPFTRGVPISDGFGYRSAPCSGCSSMHQGIDMNPGRGTPIQIIADGVVAEIGNPSGELGVYAIIDHVIDGQKVSSLYAHMLAGSLRVGVGDKVRVTDIVGQVGSTGMSTGAHLHFGILLNGTPIDPWPYMKQKVGS